MTGHPATSDQYSYEIRIRGHLDARWATALELSGLTLEAGGITVLRKDAMDQPALHGLLQRLRDLSLPLLSVSCIDPGQPHADPTATQGERP